MMFGPNFLKGLLSFGALFGPRATKLSGLRDASNTVTDTVIFTSPDIITLTTIPDFLQVGRLFRVKNGGGANQDQLFKIESIAGNSLTVSQTAVVTFTGSATIDARIAIVLNSPEFVTLNADGNTIFNVNQELPLSNLNDGSCISNKFSEHYHSAFNIYLSNADNDFVANNVKEALEEVYGIASPLTVPIHLIYNGTLSKGDFIGYSNLLPGDQTPVVAPITGTFASFTWSNSNISADFTLQFRKNSTVATPFFSYTRTNTQFESVTLPTPQSFTAGDQIFIEYVDQGSNARDAAIILNFRS